MPRPYVEPRGKRKKDLKLKRETKLEKERTKFQQRTGKKQTIQAYI